MSNLKKHKLKFVSQPVTLEEDEQIRGIAETRKLPYALAKEAFLGNKTTLKKWLEEKKNGV